MGVFEQSGQFYGHVVGHAIATFRVVNGNAKNGVILLNDKILTHACPLEENFNAGDIKLPGETLYAS